MSAPVNRRTFMALMGAVGAGLILPATFRRAQAGEPPAAAPGGAPGPAPTRSAPALLVADRTDSNRVIPAKIHPSGFKRADSCWNSLSLASDGRLYFTLSIHAIDGYARLFRYDPATDEVKQLCDFGELTGEAARKMIPQGKSHSPWHEYDGKVYTGSHYGYFRTVGNKEQPAAPPEGYLPYPGGHIISCDLRTGACEDVAVTVPEDGLQTMTLDPARGRIYGLTWPHGYFLTYDLGRRELHNLGKVSRDGEAGEGDRYLCLCRALGVVPETGDVYFTNADGEILRYRLEKDAIESVPGVTMRRDAFGTWDPSRPGHQGYNWRDIFWHAGHRVFYGVHPRSAWLFRFDPAEPRLELIERIAAAEIRHSGAFEPFRYGYITLRLGADKETIYYLTDDRGLTTPEGRRVRETVHLITYNLRTGQYADHGRLRLTDGRYPTMSQTLALHPNGRLYACPWIENPRSSEARARGEYGGATCDLISFEMPA